MTQQYAPILIEEGAKSQIWDRTSICGYCELKANLPAPYGSVCQSYIFKSSRAMIIRWISLVPPPRVLAIESRTSLSIGYSFM
jgi:hypothetical protein